MDAAPLVRMRWRLRGAWLWPSFFVLSAADAVIIHSLPPSGDSESLVGGWLLGAVLSLIGIALLSSGVGIVVRRIRPDMPKIVARNYAGALITLVVTLAFLAAGLVNQQAIASAHAALREAAARAEAYIGTHAPAAFQKNLHVLYSDPVEPPISYYFCAADATHHYYCVIVDLREPFARSVHYSGAESSTMLQQGTN